MLIEYLYIIDEIIHEYDYDNIYQQVGACPLMKFIVLASQGIIEL